MTHRWLHRCFEAFNATESKYGYNQTLFPIVQGSTYRDLRTESAETIASFGADGNAIGGLSVGEPEDELYEMTEHVCAILPSDKPRYLMGVGTPKIYWNALLWESICLIVSCQVVMPDTECYLQKTGQLILKTKNGLLISRQSTVKVLFG